MMSLVIRITLPLLLLLSSFANGQAAEVGKGLGDGHDGNRASITHLIELFDENDVQIKATDRQARPVSMRVTCGKCHDYDTIASGWHFHSGTTNVLSGRLGEPWVLTDNRIRTQIPISDRGWKGTYNPSDVDLTAWKFLKKFSSHHPGGGYGEIEPSDEEEDGESLVFMRSQISGKYEINCLACHHADRKHNQSDAALEAAKQNYRWAATVASGLATVKGSASQLDDMYDPEFDGQKIITNYDKSRFNSEDKVFFDIVRKPPSNRCYFCHSTQDLQTPGDDEWVHNEDIHMTAGMSCSDCHRNGADHMISRGDIETLKNPHGSEDYLKAYDPKKFASYSCRGCHMGVTDSDDPAARMGGHLGAPVPQHKGIPPIHFEKLSCTACHSGHLPGKKTGRVRTAKIHKLGRHGPHGRIQPQLPHVVTPVFARMANGKIGPHNMIWPSFWGTQTNGVVKPLAPELVRELAPKELGLDIKEPERVNDWIELKEKQIGDVLKAIDKFNEKREEGQPELNPVYVAGGQLHRLSSNGVVVSETHEAAEPYKWPIAHDVRPAAQSLGSNGRCADCHDKNAPFIFGEVEVDTPLNPADTQTVAMNQFGGLDRNYYQMFAFTFLFRPWLKGVVIFAAVLLGLVLLLFVLKGLDVVVRAAGNKAADEE